MPRNQNKACLPFELDLRGCDPCTEPQFQAQPPQPKPGSRGRMEEREHGYKKHTRHHPDPRPESPPIAARARARPPPVERHTARHRTPSKTRARSPVVEEAPVTHGRRSNRVRRRDTAPAHPEEATSSHRHTSSPRTQDENPMAPQGHALPYDAQFQGWVPGGRWNTNFSTEQTPAPPPPQHMQAPGHNDDPGAPLNWVPPSVEIPPPPPLRRRYTSDSARHTDPPLPGGWYVDGATAEPSTRGARQDPLHRNKNFSDAADMERPAARERHKRDHNRLSTDNSTRKDARRKRDHAQDRAEHETHYSVRFKYVHPTPDGPPGGWYQHEEFSHPRTTHYHTAYETHYHPDPYASTHYGNDPPSFHTYTEGGSYDRSGYPHPSTSRRDYYQEYRGSSGRHRHDYPPHGAAEAVPPVKDLTEHWAVLGLQEGADEAAIRSAYKKMALKCHPDRQVGSGKDEREKKKMQELFLKVKAAHDALLEK